MAVALIVLGFALENVWHYMVVAVFYGLQVVGIMIATTAVNAFLLDAYPEGSGEVGAWIVFGRVFGGFMALPRREAPPGAPRGVRSMAARSESGGPSGLRAGQATRPTAPLAGPRG